MPTWQYSHDGYAILGERAQASGLLYQLCFGQSRNCYEEQKHTSLLALVEMDAGAADIAVKERLPELKQPPQLDGPEQARFHNSFPEIGVYKEPSITMSSRAGLPEATARFTAGFISSGSRIRSP